MNTNLPSPQVTFCFPRMMAALTLTGLLLAAPISVSAVVVLAVDFDAASPVNDTEDGFQKWNVGVNDFAGPSSKAFGDFSVTIAGGASVDGSGNLNSTAIMLGRERTAPGDASGFAYDDLYRDTLIGKSNAPVAFQVSGLAASTEYQVKLYAYDNDASAAAQFTNLTGGASTVLGTISWTQAFAFDSGTSNDVFALTVDITSDAQGRITILSQGSPSGSGRINGFEISAIPEPSAALLGLLPLLGLAGLRRARGK